MSQNLISLDISAEDLGAIDQALSVIETRFAGLLALEADERRALVKMGDKSEAFCRQTLMALVQNPQVVPPSLDVSEATDDLRAIDALRPRLARLERLVERVNDTAIALGSDVMMAALEGYALLKVSGRGQGLEGLRSNLGQRFSGGPHRPAPAPQD
ncbi:hypothetical protein ACFOLC_07460 [Lysobacter cavernae]|uniref:Flagellar protein FlgN n=1 Tax=Lysobacter cavernae TaxID=1685901 RepID=A0ABV7RPU3_9GAMM